MKRNLLLIAMGLLCIINRAFTQPNVFNPNDPIVNYNPSSPPAEPPANTLAKWVRTVRPEMNFSTERFKSYYFNGMPFRLRYPNGYDPANPNKKYPVILFFHGIGEIAPVTDNEFQLYWGAQKFESLINGGQFDAFLLFPTTRVGDWSPNFANVNQVLDSMQKYCNADPDRIITMGLSLGGDGTLKYSFDFPKRSAVSIASSPGSIPTFIQQEPNPYVHIPFWVATGAYDTFSPPPSVQAFVDKFRSRGGDIRWTLFPDKGHGTWVEHWEEPFLVPYWKAAHKANPLIFFQQNQFPPNSPVNARIGITPGFAQYEWQRDNAIIAGATSNEIIATQTGTYRVRFRRDASPNWSEWSPNPAIISRSEAPPDSIPPSAPANLKVVSASANAVNLDWDNSTDNVGVTGYDVYVDGVLKYTTATSEISAAGLTPATSYTFSVKARDQAGNVSGFSNTITGSTSGTSGGGLSYRYFEGTWNALPDFSSLTPVKSGTSPNVDLGMRNRNDNFAVIWEGSINITTPGSYTFETISDDGSKLYFNTTYSAGATALVNNDGLHAPTPKSGTVTIPAAGSYPIVITYFEQSGGETMEVYWSGPGFGRQLIPNSAFSTSTPPPPSGNGLNYKYYEGVWNTLPNFNALTPVKSGNSPNVDLGIRNVNDNFAVIWEGSINITTPGNYTFETVSDDGSKLYFNTTYSAGASALVNNDGLHAPTSASGTVTIPAAGSYPIVITYFEQSGGETMEVYWSGPGFSRQLIPNSAFIASTPPPPSGNGLNYKYYEGVWNTLPNFNALTPVKSGNSPNVDLGIRNVNDNFAVIWEGSINITTPGSYTFETVSDDGSKLYFNTTYSAGASALVNNDGLHAPTSASGTVTIPAAGSYPIVITYFEQSGGETMQVYWSGPGFSRQLIPNSAFSGGGTTPPAAPGLNYKYYEGAWSALPNFSALTPVKTGTTPNVDLAMRNVNDNFGVLWEGYINIATPGSYTFETISDDGSKLYFNSTYSAGAAALVNNDGLHAPASATGTVSIPSAGLYPIAITYFEQGGGETMQVYWSGPGIARQLIPNSAFRQTNVAAADMYTLRNAGQDKDANIEIATAYPNPFTGKFNIAIDNPAGTEKVTATIYDVTGKLVHSKYFGNIAAGKTILTMDTGGKQIVAGVYFLQLDVKGRPRKVIQLIKR